MLLSGNACRKKFTDWETNLKIIRNVRVLWATFLEFRKSKHSFLVLVAIVITVTTEVEEMGISPNSVLKWACSLRE